MKALVLSSLVALFSTLPLGAQPDWKWLVSKTDGSAADLSPAGLGSTDRPWPAYDYRKHQVVYGLGRFFFAGKCSPDGIVWADCGFEPTHAAGDRVFRIVSVSTDYGTEAEAIVPYDWYTTLVRVSSDGLTSTPVDVKMPTPRSIAYGAGTYVVVGQDGGISTSPDAFTWTAASSGTARTLYDVTYASGRFIAVGDGGTILTSTNGQTWTAEVLPSLALFSLRNVAADSAHVVIAATAEPPLVETGALTLSGGTPVSLVRDHRNDFNADEALLAGSLVSFGGQWYAAPYFSRYYYKYPKFLTSTDAATWTAMPVELGVQQQHYFSASLAASPQAALFLALRGDDFSYDPHPAPRHPLEYLLLRATTGPDALPVITHQPVSVTLARGETASFSVGATGTGPLSYQWFHEDAVIAGATAPVLTLRLADNADAGNYSVRIANALGSATTEAATLVVNPTVSLAVTTQPVGGVLYDGTDLTLRVAVTGSGPISYQWRRNGVALTSETTPTLRLYGYSYSLDSTVGTYDVVATAPYSTITSAPAVVTRGGPKVTISPSGIINVAAGDSVTITATATGDGPLTFHWTRTIGGLDVASSVLTLDHVTVADSSPYRVEVTDVNGHQDRASFIISVAVPDPVIEMAPVSQTVVAGGRVTLHLGVVAPENYAFQWRHDGTPIPGATATDLTIGNFSAADEGQYDAVITGGGVYKTSTAATLTLSRSRLVNLSARAIPGAGEDTFAQGFVLRGEASDAAPDILVRSVGPGLAALGIANPLADPALRVVDRQAAVVAENDNWNTASATGRGVAASAADMTRFGAFALSENSRDSAVLIRRSPAGVFSALVAATAGNNGVVLNEIYGPVTGSQRLVNLSARARVYAGEGVLVAGFVISGNSPLRLLIRGVGPTLASQGIAHPLANPKITLFNRQGQEIHNNDNWGDAANVADIPAAATATGAFPLPAGSNDAVMLETLAPGIYTAHVTPADGTSTGVALVEIYEVP